MTGDFPDRRRTRADCRGNGRRACRPTTQSVTAVAHLNMILVSHIMSQRGKDEAFSDILIVDSRTYVKQLILSERQVCLRTGRRPYHGGTNYCKVRILN